MAGAALLNVARGVHVTSPAGTDLSMDVTGRAGLANYGAADRSGHLDFWGLSAVQAAQVEGTTDGLLVRLRKINQVIIAILALFQIIPLTKARVYEPLKS